MSSMFNFSVVPVRDPRFPEPKNWFIMEAKGTLYGPIDKEEVDRIAERFIGEIEPKVFVMWYGICRTVPEELDYAFIQTFGFAPPKQ